MQQTITAEKCACFWPALHANCEYLVHEFIIAAQTRTYYRSPYVKYPTYELITVPHKLLSYTTHESSFQHDTKFQIL
jgi:hypothetical protein